MQPTPPDPQLPNPALEAQLAATGLSRDAAFAALTAEEEKAGRTCGSCTMCCHLVGVPELDKPPGPPCGHLCASGCGVYEARPGGCRVYACAWKLGLGHEDERPDKAGGLLEWHELDDGLHPFAGYWVFRVEGDMPGPVGIRLLDGLRAIGSLVMVYRGPGEPMTMYYPDDTEDPEAGVAPSWADEQAGEPMDFRVASFDSYKDDLDPDVLAAILRAAGS